MAVKIRLARAGAKKAPFYRVVAADSRAPRDGRFIEILGRYNPRTDPSTIELDLDKVDAWIAKGAQPTETVGKLIAIARNPEAAPPAKTAPLSKKAAAKAAEAEKKAAEAAPAPAKEPEAAPVEEAEVEVVEDAAAQEPATDEAADAGATEETAE
ncbi:MAG: 30S ribosomal protein S16 [Coriobacteriia bacterium]|nr:30S ribosomal protein S16 [Actinomycetota bacterium]MDZ4167326.1 30S ribosomal protein S16 [Coriobacteriia bacterium]